MEKRREEVILRGVREGCFDPLIARIINLVRATKNDPGNIEEVDRKLLTNQTVIERAAEIFRRLKNKAHDIAVEELRRFLAAFNWPLPA